MQQLIQEFTEAHLVTQIIIGTIYTISVLIILISVGWMLIFISKPLRKRIAWIIYHDTKNKSFTYNDIIVTDKREFLKSIREFVKYNNISNYASCELSNLLKIARNFNLYQVHPFTDNLVRTYNSRALNKINKELETRYQTRAAQEVIKNNLSLLNGEQ
jgi:hypothetical protein